jgi:regulator of sigma E protease
MPYVYAVLALVLLVVVHELGHFLAARAVGVRATKFYVFFPPAIFKRKVGDVEYGIGAIPAGGFVKLPGMFRPEAGEVAERVRWDLERVQDSLDADERLRADAARRSIAHAADADAIVEPLRDLREVVVAHDPSATSTVDSLLDDLHPRAYWRAALWRRMTVIFAGPFVNLVVGFVALACFYWMLQPTYEVSGPLRVVEVTKGSPAAEAGITQRSRITEWNGPVKGVDPYELSERIADGLGKPTELAWTDGDGGHHDATVTPRVLDGDAADGDEPRLGLAPDFGEGLPVRVTGRERTDVGTGIRGASEDVRSIVSSTFTRLPRVFFDTEARKDVGSVVGIVQVANDVDKAGLFVRYVAIISLVLAVMNLLPLLPLDGGHLLFGILEAARRRPMPRAAFERYSMVGLAVVLILFFIGLDNDIARARG